MQLTILRRAAHNLGLALFAGLLAACAAPTPEPGAFETALAGTVAAGAAQIAADFSGQRATLTAEAPAATATVPTATFTSTPEDTATLTETATPTDTPTPVHSPPPTPPPPTPTPTLGPVTAGTYAQNGVCTQVPGYANVMDPSNGNQVTIQLGRWSMCVGSIVVRPSLELQVNVTWTTLPYDVPYYYRNVNHITLPPHDPGSQAVYLTDTLGNRYEQIQLDGAARDGGNGSVGTVLSDYYLFPGAKAGARAFTLVISDKDRTIPNLTLTTLMP